MEEKLEYWRRKYNLNNLVISGYRGGYPIITFDKEDNMPVCFMTEREKKRIIRKAETYGGIELGVAYNLRKTADIMVFDNQISILGHEYVIDRILDAIF